ncbi:unnamed protein product, partial [Closterium sp. NIES-64]
MSFPPHSLHVSLPPCPFHGHTNLLTTPPLSSTPSPPLPVFPITLVPSSHPPLSPSSPPPLSLSSLLTFSSSPFLALPLVPFPVAALHTIASRLKSSFIFPSPPLPIFPLPVAALHTIASSLTSSNPSSTPVAALHTIASTLTSSNPFFHAWSGNDPCVAVAPGGGGGGGGGAAAGPSSKGWQGVTCESDGSGNHVVTALTLQGLGLSGQLPPALFELTALKSLDISLNPALTGSIYSTISALSELSMLDMHGCNLSGSIPSTISLLRNLNFFAVNSNQLSGSIPRQVANLTNLYFFDITDNNISGPVPIQPGFDTCTSMGHLHLSRNQLTYVPGELGRLPNLIHLLVDNNRLNQTFPAGLSGSTSLQIIHLSNNTIQGWLPPSLSLPALQDLSMHNCSMQPQPLPPLTGLPSLCYLDLSRNNFQGPLPLALFTTHPDLVTLNLALNHLNGTLPPGLPSANLTRLHSIILSDNKLTGPVPPLDALPVIATISLFDNHFTRAPAALLSNENVTLQLYGNDLCVPYRPAVTAACSPPLGFMQYQPPPICDDLACPSLYAPSPPLLALTNVCVCASPLEVELKLTAPQYAVFNDELASLLVERIAGSLGKNGIGISTGQLKLTAPQYAVFHDDLASLLVERVAESLGKNGIGISTGQVGLGGTGGCGGDRAGGYVEQAPGLSSLLPPSAPPSASFPHSPEPPSPFPRSPLPHSPEPPSPFPRAPFPIPPEAPLPHRHRVGYQAYTLPFHLPLFPFSYVPLSSFASSPLVQQIAIVSIREAFVWHKVLLGTDFRPHIVEAMYGPAPPPAPPVAAYWGRGHDHCCNGGSLWWGEWWAVALITLLIVWLVLLRNRKQGETSGAYLFSCLCPLVVAGALCSLPLIVLLVPSVLFLSRVAGALCSLPLSCLLVPSVLFLSRVAGALCSLSSLVLLVPSVLSSLVLLVPSVLFLSRVAGATLFSSSLGVAGALCSLPLSQVRSCYLWSSEDYKAIEGLQALRQCTGAKLKEIADAHPGVQDAAGGGRIRT